MALYVGSQKHKLIVNNEVVTFNLAISQTINNDELLATSDEYILTDINDKHLIVKRSGS